MARSANPRRPRKPQSDAAHETNLYDCRNGWKSCDVSKLTPLEAKQAAIANRSRNLADCKSGYGDCDTSVLSDSESAIVIRARHDRNIDDCNQGASSCDTSHLTPPEARAVAEARRQRNLEDCRSGAASCDHAALSASEALLREAVTQPTVSSPGGLKSLVRSVKGSAEADAIRGALERTNGNRKAAADFLGISYKALLYKIREYDVEVPGVGSRSSLRGIDVN